MLYGTRTCGDSGNGSSGRCLNLCNNYFYSQIYDSHLPLHVALKVLETCCESGERNENNQMAHRTNYSAIYDGCTHLNRMFDRNAAFDSTL